MEESGTREVVSTAGYDLIERWTKTEDGSEHREKLRSQLNEARVMLQDDSEDDLLWACRRKALEDIAFSGWKMNGDLEKIEKRNLYFENTMSLDVLEEFMRYRAEYEENANRIHVDETVMLFAQLDAWTSCVGMTMDTRVGGGRQSQMLFTTLYGRDLRRAVVGLLKVA